MAENKCGFYYLGPEAIGKDCKPFCGDTPLCEEAERKQAAGAEPAGDEPGPSSGEKPAARFPPSPRGPHGPR